MHMPTAKPRDELENHSEFIARHIGISAADEQHILGVIGAASRRALIEAIVPRSIARRQSMQLPAPITEAAALAELKADEIIRNTYRTLMSRGMKGCYVYFTDTATAKYFKDHLPK
jgi:glycine dehydrogenase